MNKVIYSVYPAKDLPKVTPDVIYIKKKMENIKNIKLTLKNR